MVSPDSDNGNNGDNGEIEPRSQAMSLDSRVILLSERIRNLTREVRQLKSMLSSDKKELVLRLGKLEVTYQRVFGIILVFPILGAVLGFIATYWSSLFKPLVR